MKNISLLDILILPRGMYKKLSDKLLGIFPGIIIIGIADLFFYILFGWKSIFSNKYEPVLIYNIVMTVLIIIFAGFIKLIAFSFPIFDILKRFRLEIDFFDGTNKLIKLMKVYAIANIMLIVMEGILFFVFYKYNMEMSQYIKTYIVMIYANGIVPVWFSAIITRGINSIYILKQRYKNLMFIIVFIWNFLISIAFETIFRYLILLFR